MAGSAAFKPPRNCFSHTDFRHRQTNSRSTYKTCMMTAPVVRLRPGKYGKAFQPKWQVFQSQRQTWGTETGPRFSSPFGPGLPLTSSMASAGSVCKIQARRIHRGQM